MTKDGLFKTASTFIILSLLCHAYMLRSENKEYDLALTQMDNGFQELMALPVRGKPLSAYVNSDQVGVFKIGGRSIGCAVLKADLPAPRKK